MVTVALLEVYHSRPVAPTRRVALGKSDLPCDPAPGLGGVLLAGMVAFFVPALDPDLSPELVPLMRQIERGAPIAQPRLRHRFQRDLIGLSRSDHRLIAAGDELRFEFGRGGTPEQQVLGALYAAAQLPPALRRVVIDAQRRSLTWRGPLGSSFVASVMGSGRVRGWTAASIADPLVWARGILGVAERSELDRGDIQRRFRVKLRQAHPDSGGDSDAAAGLINDLTEARRILLGGAEATHA